MRCCDNKLNNFLDVLGLPPLPYDEAGTLLAISPDNEIIRVEKPDIEISVSWDDITDKPTTLGGYGITDALTKDESDERYAPKEHTHLVEDIVDFPETWDWDDLTGAPQSTPQEIDNVVNNAVINGENPPVNIQTTQGDIQLSPQGKIIANSNIDLSVGYKILAMVTVGGNKTDLAIVQVENYINIANPITGEVYADWLQTDFGNTHTPLNLSHSNNPLTGKYIAYDVGAWIFNTTDYPAMTKQILATFTEGILHLDSKYFNPVDNGSGGLILSGITWNEIQAEYYKYQAGLTAIQTNKSGLISISDISFNINDATIYFNYRFSLGDYETGRINIYQALISATEANIIAPVNLVHTFTLSDNNFTDFYKNLIETTNQQTQENTTAIEALKGAIIYIGEINLNTENVTQQSLTDRAAELGYDVLQAGYTLIDLDSNQWTYNGTEWINIGNNNVSTATNDTIGVVKGSTESLKVSVDIGGEMSVNSLESTLNNKADKAATLMGYGITDAYTKNEVDAISALSVKKSGDNMTGPLNGTAVNLSGLSTANGYVKSGSDDSYFLTGGGGHTPISNFATSAQLANYLPLTGGTLTGTLNINTGANSLLLTGTANQGIVKQDGSGNTISGITFAGTGRLTLYGIEGITDGIYIRPVSSGSSTAQTVFTSAGTTFNTPLLVNSGVTATGGFIKTTDNDVLLAGGGTTPLSNLTQPIRVKQLTTTSTPAGVGDMVLNTTYNTFNAATVVSTQNNAYLKAHMTFDPDNSVIVLAESVSDKNIEIRCDFYIGATKVDEVYANIVRSNNLQSLVFESVQNVTAGQVISIRLTAKSTANGAGVRIPASPTNNYITIS